MATSVGLAVSRVASASVLKLSPVKVKTTKRAKVDGRVTSTGLTPTGQVTITRNGKRIATVALKGGRATITLPKLKKGKYKIAASYAGDTQVLASSARPSR